ncbi:putative capsid protein [Klebsiella phage vB_KpnS_Uniso31]|uniref:Capsid protein n=1 Tax=Klebsiella phage vB_KpnS_Uniso31 TaxID=2951200 RepID=A0A9E7SYZ2_9CAUD|nr:putative capsid protein [Klebsiella phage vB_KpnS_Uniso31]
MYLYAAFNNYAITSISRYRFVLTHNCRSKHDILSDINS